MEDKLNRIPFTFIIDKKDLIGVEIGVDNGDNALNILQNLDIKRLYLIDPYNSWLGKGKKAGSKLAYREAVNKLKDYKDKIIWILEKSEDVVSIIPNDLDFVYIDGNHSYEFVKKDIELYVPKVKSGGLIAGHDFNILDVLVAVMGYFNCKGVNYCNSRDCKDVQDWFYIDDEV